MKYNITLIGMMGSGKTTIGRVCSRKLNYNFVDTDNLIIQKMDMEISEIFKLKGEKYFRDIEKLTIKALANSIQTIISPGGGAILDKDNIEVFRELGPIIYLRATPEYLFNNLKNSKRVRPLIQSDNPLEKLEEIFQQRKLIYEQSADYSINVEDKPVEDIADQVIEWYTKWYNKG